MAEKCMASSLWDRFSESNFSRFAAGLLTSGGRSILVVPWENLADSAELSDCVLDLSFLHHVSLGNCIPADWIASSSSSAWGLCTGILRLLRRRQSWWSVIILIPMIFFTFCICNDVKCSRQLLCTLYVFSESTYQEGCILVGLFHKCPHSAPDSTFLNLKKLVNSYPLPGCKCCLLYIHHLN